MASTWSAGGLNLRLMTTGENDNTWGDQTNDNLKRLENKITGYAAVTLSGTTHTLTFTDNPTSYADEDGRNFVLNFGGSPGGTCTVTIPARETVYLVLNNTADSNDITLTTGSGTTFTVPSGKDAFVYSDGTNVYNAMADAIFTTITGDGSALTGVLHDVVDDTTPQLGGNLDLNSNNITGTGNVNITGTVTATSYSGDGSSLTGITSVGGATGVDFNDNVKARFGTGNDLEIYHDGSNSYVSDQGTGSLFIQATDLILEDSTGTNYLYGSSGGSVILYHNGNQKLSTGSAGVTVTGTVTADGISLGDNEKAQFGASNDLEIYHSGSDSYIKDTGTGDLYIGGSSNIWFTRGDGTGASAQFITDGACKLRYNNSTKFETTSGGIAVTGAITATGDITAFYTSDKTLKTNIENITNPMDKVKELNGVSYNWTEEAQEKYNHLNDQKEIGVIAQEVEKVLPEMVTEREDGTKAVRYERMCALLIECVKDLQKQITELKNGTT